MLWSFRVIQPQIQFHPCSGRSFLPGPDYFAWESSYIWSRVSMERGNCHISPPYCSKLLHFTLILVLREKILWRQDYRDWRTNHAWPRGRFRLTGAGVIPGGVGALRTRGLDFITERGLVVDEVRFWDNDPTDQKFCHVHPQLCPNMAFLLGNPLYFYVSSGRLPWSWMLDRKSDKKRLVPQLISSFNPTHAGFHGNKTTLFWNALLGAQLKIFL